MYGLKVKMIPYRALILNIEIGFMRWMSYATWQFYFATCNGFMPAQIGDW